MTRWDAFDESSAAQDGLTHRDRRAVRSAGRGFRRPGVVAPVWAPRVDAEREDPRVVVELAWRDSDQFSRSPTVAQRVIEDAVDVACEGGAPRVVAPDDAASGAASQ